MGFARHSIPSSDVSVIEISTTFAEQNTGMFKAGTVELADPNILARRVRTYASLCGIIETLLSQPENQTIASDGLPARPTGQWVSDKKFYLERYLSVAMKAVGKKWDGKLIYVDLFAGPGRSVIRDSGAEVDGSPLVAMNLDFAKFVFVDTPAVIATLRQRIARHPRFDRVVLIEGDCNDVIDLVRDQCPPDHLTLAFIDPTGLQIRFSTIKKLITGRKIDLLMTIQSGMGISMNLHQYARTEGKALTGFLGNTHWREDIQKGATPSQASKRILDRYMGQLKALGYQTAENREISVRTDNNVPLYYVVLASRHPRGPDLWKKITAVGPSGQRKLKGF